MADPLSALEQAVQWEREQVAGLSSCCVAASEPCELCWAVVDRLIAVVRAHERARCRKEIEVRYEEGGWISGDELLAAIDALDATP